MSTGFGVIVDDITGNITDTYSVNLAENAEKDIIKRCEDVSYAFLYKDENKLIFIREDRQFHCRHRLVFELPSQKIGT